VSTAEPIEVALVAIPEAMPSTLAGLHDVLSSVATLPGPATGRREPFRVRIVGREAGVVRSASGLPIAVERTVGEEDRARVVIVPSLLAEGGRWTPGRHPEVVGWLAERHRGGAVICSACSGLLLIAETGLFDGHGATIHYDYADGFRRTFPAVPVSPERVLVVSGAREELVSSGASTSWHDLALYLIARFVGPTAAQAVARAYAFQWHVVEGRVEQRVRGESVHVPLEGVGAGATPLCGSGVGALRERGGRSDGAGWAL
jgi:transcriptional regulator GlxA family with amidase domain